MLAFTRLPDFYTQDPHDAEDYFRRSGLLVRAAVSGRAAAWSLSAACEVFGRCVCWIVETRATTLSVTPVSGGITLLQVLKGHAEVAAGKTALVLNARAGPVVVPKAPCQINLPLPSRFILLHVQGEALRCALSEYGARAGLADLSARAALMVGLEGSLQLSAGLAAILKWRVEDRPSLGLSTKARSVLGDVVALRVAYLLAVQDQASEADKAVLHPGLQVAKQFIAERYAEPVNFETIATLSGLSLRTLQQLFRTHLACTMTEYVRRHRLLQARKALLAAGPKDKVSAIAHACGFVHMGDFARQYQEIYQETPAQTLLASKLSR